MEVSSLYKTQEALLDQLALNFFEVVPTQWRTHCAATARISQQVLQHFGLHAELTPCQLWYSAPQQNVVIGFIDRPLPPGQWNGHVVCTVEAGLIDAATFVLKKRFNIEAPSTVSARRFKIPAQAIGRADLNDRERLWWFAPPRGADITLPDEPQALLSGYAEQLINKLQRQG